MKPYKSVEVFSMFSVKPPRIYPKAPPQNRKAPLLKTFWRRFWFSLFCKTFVTTSN